VTQNTADASFGQPRFSPDAISQFQVITNRFDATLGRSAGVAVNVQSKTGTNQIHGSAFGYFRNSAFNAGDPILKAQGNPIPITPLSDQQYGGTIGGPIRKREALVLRLIRRRASVQQRYQTTPLLPGSVSSAIPQLLTVNEYLGRVDFQANGKNHIFVRGNGFHIQE